MSGDRLTALDAGFLAAESGRTPMHVGSVGLFEGGPFHDADGGFRIDELRARIGGRLHLLPRMRQRPVALPFGLARPVWTDDPAFDIANHVDVVVLPDGDDAALASLVEDVMMQRLRRDRPLWHMRFVTGLRDGRVALIERAHHAMVDGVSGVDISLVLLDLEPDAPAVAGPPWQPKPPPRVWSQVASAVVDAARPAAELARPGGARRLASALYASRGTRLRTANRDVHRPVGSARRIVFLRESFAGVHDAAVAAGATVNDVVLAAVAGAVRSLFVERGESLTTDRTFTALVPVSLRTADEAGALGNRVGAMLIDLPIGIGDPAERLTRVMAATRHHKARGEAQAAEELIHAVDALPAPASALLAHAVHHQPLVDTVVTNVPGPRAPLYALGARLLEAYPFVPLGGNLDFEVAVLSYDGALTFGITADADTCPDVAVLGDGLRAALRQLGAHWTPLAGDA